MNIKDTFLLLAATCIFSLGFAQCPDSVRVYVYPEVICPGEVAHLSTDSTLLHCVNIGDIICVNSNTQDTAIVSPSDWTRLNLASTYTPFSVVFYVDETCRHGWAIGLSFSEKKWNNNTISTKLIDSLPSPSTAHDAANDFDGNSNTQTIRTSTTAAYSTTKYPAVGSIESPFYLPALGQLNYLTSQMAIVNIALQLFDSFLPVGNWCSSTQYDKTRIWFVGTDFSIVIGAKINNYYVIPVMNF